MGIEEDEIKSELRYKKGTIEDLEIERSSYEIDTWEAEGSKSHSHWKAKRKGRCPPSSF